MGVDHVGIAVRDPRARLAIWAETIGLKLERVERIETEGVRTWFLSAGTVDVELLEPTGEDTPVGRFLSRRGEGIHHLCLRVDDLEAILTRLAAAGIDPVGGEARAGAGGARVAFLHPKDTGGVLIELSQSRGPAEGAGVAFAPGSLAVIYMREPRERFVGVLRSLDVRGASVLGMDLEAWDDWIAQWARGEEGPLAPSLQFFPVARIEKILSDHDSADLPSLARRFRERTGRALSEALPSLTSSGEEHAAAGEGASDDG